MSSWPYCVILIFATAPSVAMNCATHKGTSTDIWPLVSAAEAILLALVSVTHPPHENPIIRVATAPMAIPCSRRVPDCPCRIDGTSIASPFHEGDPRHKQRTDRL